MHQEPIQFDCPVCHLTLTVPREMAGLTGPCLRCQTLIVVPEGILIVRAPAPVRPPPSLGLPTAALSPTATRPVDPSEFPDSQLPPMGPTEPEFGVCAEDASDYQQRLIHPVPSRHTEPVSGRKHKKKEAEWADYVRPMTFLFLISGALAGLGWLANWFFENNVEPGMDKADALVAAIDEGRSRTERYYQIQKELASLISQQGAAREGSWRHEQLEADIKRKKSELDRVARDN